MSKYMKLVYGDKSDYDALTTKDSNTIYIINNTPRTEIYIGSDLVANGNYIPELDEKLDCDYIVDERPENHAQMPVSLASLNARCNGLSRLSSKKFYFIYFGDDVLPGVDSSEWGILFTLIDTEQIIIRWNGEIYARQAPSVGGTWSAFKKTTKDIESNIASLQSGKLDYKELAQTVGSGPLDLSTLNSKTLSTRTFYYLHKGTDIIPGLNNNEWVIYLPLKDTNQLIIRANGDIYSRERPSIGATWGSFTRTNMKTIQATVTSMSDIANFTNPNDIYMLSTNAAFNAEVQYVDEGCYIAELRTYHSGASWYQTLQYLETGKLYYRNLYNNPPTWNGTNINDAIDKVSSGDIFGFGNSHPGSRYGDGVSNLNYQLTDSYCIMSGYVSEISGYNNAYYLLPMPALEIANTIIKENGYDYYLTIDETTHEDSTNHYPDKYCYLKLERADNNSYQFSGDNTTLVHFTLTYRIK